MSEIKVNKISPRSGTTVTLGDSGDTFTIPSGATINNQGTAVNFGATGSASWVTTVKTGDFTAVAGEGYFVNTTSGEIDVTLPASPTAGAVVAISDYANNFATNNCILLRNGSKIGGNAADATLIVNGAAITLVFIDATKGWIVTDSGNQSEASELKEYVAATGGTITTSGNFKIHTFTGPGTFAVSSAGNAAGSNTVDYLVVAGGASGGRGNAAGAGGGGAGGLRVSPGSASGCWTASPRGASPAVALPVSGGPFSITVGGGGASQSSSGGAGVSGSVSTFSSITSAGGGGGAGHCAVSVAGGSGGGGSAAPNNPSRTNQAGGAGNTPPTNPIQGTSGGNGGANTGGYPSGGGGGAIAGGSNGVCSPVDSAGGNGGNGAQVNIDTNNHYWAAGGGGSAWTGGGGQNGGGGGLGGGGGAAGPGGGGSAGTSALNSGDAGNTTTGGGGGTNTGSGGGGGNGPSGSSGGGGSGIVIIRYKFQN